MKILEIGGGTNPVYCKKFNNGINIDILQHELVDITHDLRKFPYPIQDKEFDIVYNKFVIEHISWRLLDKFIGEIYRILKDGGKAITICPDLYKQCEIILNKKGQNLEINLEPDIQMIFGDQNYDWNYHASSCTPELYEKLFKNAGFENIDIKQFSEYEIIIESYKKKSLLEKLLSEEYSREYFEDGTIGYIGYRDFICHYKTADIIINEKPESILELGGARGYITRLFENHDIRSVCMDVSNHCWHTRSTDSFIIHDITDIPWPFKDKEFDLCFSIATLEHIKETSLYNIIKEMDRVSKRGFHGITFEITPQDIDKTHLKGTIKPKEWWTNKFYSVCPEYPVKIVDKEDLEIGNINIPDINDKLVKLNIGSFTNMIHYSWQNIDILDLNDFAQQNGYIFRQLDITKKLPYDDNSVDIIISSHLLEHLNRGEGEKFLNECLRILKPYSNSPNSGIIRLTIPDTRLITEKYLKENIKEYRWINKEVEQSKDDSDALFTLLISGHKTAYDEYSTIKLLEKIGFTDTEKSDFNKSSSEIIRKQSIDLLPTISCYIEAKKPNNILQQSKSNIDIKEKEELPISIYRSKKPKSNILLQPKKKLRIALISTPFFGLPPLKYGGLEMVLWDLAEGLDELDHEITIFGPEHSKSTKNGFIIHTGPNINTANIDWFQAEKDAYQKYKDIITPDKFDIVHDMTWYGFPYLIKYKYPNLKVIHTMHGGLTWDSPPNKKPNLVAISKFMQKYTIKYFDQKGYYTQCKYVYNGIDLNKYIYYEDNNIKKTNRLLFVGRFSRLKQPHVAIQLAKSIDMPIDLIGGSFVDDMNYIREIEQMSDDKNICIHKDVSHDFKIRKMQEALALIAPSNFGEPFNLTLIESNACGTPVIVTNDGGQPELVIHEKTGYVCNNIGQMTDAISKIDKINPLNCRKHVEQNFSRNIMSENYVRLYEQILNKDEW